MALLWEFWFKVNHEDLGVVDLIDVYGEQIPMLKIEAKLYQLLAEKQKFQLAYFDGKAIGFLMYKLAYDCILGIDALYVEPSHEGKGLAKALVNSLGKPVSKVLFQTHIATPPERLLEITKDKSLKEVTRSQTKITWEMPWDCLIA